MLTALALFLLAVVALLAIPATLMFQVSYRQTFQGHVTLQWAFGRVRARIPLSRAKPRPHKTTRAITRQQRRGSHEGVKPIELLGHPPFRGRVVRLLSDLWGAIGKQDIALRLRLGLGDPADTGRLWGLLGPLAGLFANLKEVQVAIEPEFIAAAFELDGHARIRIVPLRIIVPVLAFLLSPTVWQSIRRARRAA